MRFYLDEFGCAKNQVDAETMLAYLAAAAWEKADDPESADLIIINSCGFIESAKKESIEQLFALKACYPDKKLLLAGCLAQRYGLDLQANLPEADGIFGNQALSLITKVADAVMAGERPCSLPKLRGFDDETIIGSRPLLSFPGSAYLKISEGCDNGCSYCAIPLIRGRFRSRSPASVLAELKQLLSRGIREFCLIGQDLAVYGLDIGTNLYELIKAMLELEGDFWLRLLYLHPDHFSPSLLELCQADSRLLPYFDLPFQHASARLLRTMKRAGSAEAYLDLIGQIRDQLPQAVLRSTFLVGFPGETKEDFDQLLTFQAQAALDWLGVFCYSAEEGTAAYRLPGRVTRRKAIKRECRLVVEQGLISERRMARFVGQTLKILVEEAVAGEAGLYLGRAYCQAPVVDGNCVISSHQPLVPGNFVRAQVRRLAGFDLDTVYNG